MHRRGSLFLNLESVVSDQANDREHHTSPAGPTFTVCDSLGRGLGCGGAHLLANFGIGFFDCVNNQCGHCRLLYCRMFFEGNAQIDRQPEGELLCVWPWGVRHKMTLQKSLILVNRKKYAPPNLFIRHGSGHFFRGLSAKLTVLALCAAILFFLPSCLLFTCEGGMM